MSRRTHACLSCEGRTRHDDQVCSRCRRRGVRVLLVDDVADVNAPTLTELGRGRDITRYLEVPIALPSVNYRSRGA